MSNPAQVRCGIDTGGTFTDLVALDEATGDLVVAKWPSSPRNPTEALVGVIGESQISPGAFSSLILGTTVATNALLQRSGARVLFVTTKGFRDIPFIQRINRRYHYSLEWTKPKPLVERVDCLEIDERVNHKGDMLVSLTDQVLQGLAQRIAARLNGTGASHAGPDTRTETVVAVCLLFSHLNPEHERRVKQYLAERFPDVPVSLSYQVAPIWREYERGSTVLADAYVKPTLQRYIGGVRKSLENLGISCPWAVMKSNGGRATAEAAENQPVERHQR